MFFLRHSVVMHDNRLFKFAVFLSAAQPTEAHLLPECLSVCLPITLVSHAYTVQDIEIHFAPFDIGMFLVFRPNFKILNLGVTSK